MIGGLIAFLTGHRQSSSINYPYGLRSRFLSHAEFSFFRVLQQAVGDRYYILIKVRVADLLYVKRPHENFPARNRIDRKHVDFVICDPNTMQPLAAIELDDSSHQRADRRDRDSFMNAAFLNAGLPLVHIPAARSYNPRRIAEHLRQHVPT